MPSPDPFLPLHLRLTDRWVLVVGAGPVGRRRARHFLAAGARVRWVAPELTTGSPTGPAEPPAELEGLPADRCERLAAPFAPHHCDGMDLVLACAPPAVNAAVVAAAEARRLWVGRADAPALGTLEVPALIRRGALVVGLSSGVPAATAVLRRALDARIPQGFQIFVDVLAEARRRLADRPDRAARLQRLISGPLAAVLECAAPPDPAEVERWLAGED